MFILSCQVCDVEFEAKSQRRVYCSKRCNDKGKPSASGLTCFVCTSPMVKGRTSKPQGEAACFPCRRSGAALKHGTYNAYRSHGCRCRACMDGHNARMREYNAKVKARDGVSASAQFKRARRGLDPLLVLPDCFICREPLINSPQGADRPMHRACKASAPMWKQRGEESPRVVAARSLSAKAAAGTTGGKRVFVNGPCAWCSSEFTAASGVYCSARCKQKSKNHERSLVKGRFSVSPIVRKEIYERDGWRCQLCSHPVDRSLHYSASWSATLDHIVPQSLQLVPDHSPSNLRLAHRWCNSARGNDSSGMTEEAFSAQIREVFSA